MKLTAEILQYKGYKAEYIEDENDHSLIGSSWVLYEKMCIGSKSCGVGIALEFCTLDEANRDPLLKNNVYSVYNCYYWNNDYDADVVSLNITTLEELTNIEESFHNKTTKSMFWKKMKELYNI